jgi:outer membrane lipoprotein-sorting protein
MHTLSSRLFVALCLLIGATAASAQTADEIVERSLKALGGRAAHAKLTSRSTLGTILLSTPAGEVPGSIEVLNQSPNKSRTLIKADLTSLGVGQITVDQRFNGTTGYVLDSMQGNREITGGQLESMRNNTFPHPFMNYKEVGATVELKGKEKVGDREAYFLIFTPKTGAPIRQYIDAETYLPTKIILKVEVPQLGQELEQTTEFLDYKEVDGVKLPFRMKSSSIVQNFSISVTHVQHNVQVDESLFSKPSGQ